MTRDSSIYLSDILEYGRRIIAALGSLGPDELVADEFRFQAIIRYFEILGEAVNKLGPRFRGVHPEIEWSGAVALPNRLIHGYANVDPAILVQTARRDLPTFLIAIERLMNSARRSVVKICGLSTSETLDAALGASADMVGFVFFPKSPRHLSYEQAADLSGQVRGRAAIVALLVDPDDAVVEATLQAAKPDMLQLHGSETPERVAEIRARFGRPVMKAVGIAAPEDITRAESYRDVADRLLLDAKPPADPKALPGGNGLSFDWRLVAALDPALPFMLSGGLDPDNVGTAIALTGARAVDVSSGVESRPGQKDPARIEAFIRAARAAWNA